MSPAVKKLFWITELEAECDSNLAADKRMSEEEEEEESRHDLCIR